MLAMDFLEVDKHNRALGIGSLLGGKPCFCPEGVSFM
jgi:hypothetical protein